MTAGIAVLDTKAGALITAGAPHQEFASASVVKIMIATRLLLAGRMVGKVAVRARIMITRSDNDSAWALYPLVDRDALLPWLARHYGISHLGAPPTMPGIWGSTQITAEGLVRFYSAIKNDTLVWPWLSAAMHAHAATSSAGEPNDFGLAAAAPASAVKNGWATNRDVQHPTNAIINTTGFAGGDRYAVAILAEGDGSLYYFGGERVVTAAARILVGQAAAGRGRP